MRGQPLKGLRVLDLSRILAAPLAAQSLGDLGADVIKVERRGAGDDARRWGPPFLKDIEGRDTRESPMYLCANRGKRSMTLDLSSPDAQDVVRQLAKVCDVLIENFKVGDLARYGLGYAQLCELNPKLIYCSVTGFGQTGPYATRPGYDTLFQAMSGLMSVTGLPDDLPGGGPMKAGPSIADFLGGQFATAGILAALYERDVHSGLGQHIDIALLDATIAAQSHFLSTYFASGSTPQRRGTEGNGGLPSQMFPCVDGNVIVICGNDEQYRLFCKLLGHPELGTDARFATNAQRLAHRRELTTTFNALTAAWKTADLLRALHEAGIPGGPVNTYAEVFSDPQVQHRGMAVEVPHPLSGSVRLCASPIRMSASPGPAYAAPPLVGQHTDELLRELLGMSNAEIARLRECGAV